MKVTTNLNLNLKSRMVELYLYTPIHVSDVMLNSVQEQLNLNIFHLWMLLAAP
jgi:hypothetical protein